MKVVILGGTGFIGSALGAALAARGDEVCVPSRKAQPEDVAAKPGISRALWDGRDPENLARLLADADAVVNLVGENIAGRRWDEAQKRRIVDSRMQAGHALTQAFARLETTPGTLAPAVLIQASATGWYGAWPELATAPVCTEASPPGTNFLARTAVAWEDSTAELAVRCPGLRRAIIRTAPVLGGGGGLLARLLPLFRWGLGGPVGTGRQPFAWIHLDDEVAAILWLLDTPSLAGAFNLAAPEEASSADFAKKFGAALNRPAKLPAPAFALRLALGEMADELLLAGQRVQPARLLESGFAFRYPDLASALGACVASS